MTSDLGIDITIWNLALFGLLAVGVAVVVVLILRWVRTPTVKPDSTRENLEAWHAEHDRRAPKRPHDRSR